MSSTLDVILGDAAGAFTTGFIVKKLFSPTIPYRLVYIGAGAAVGAAVTDYLQVDYLPEVKDNELKWALQNPIAISALTLAYGTLYEGLMLLFLPEIALPYNRVTLLGSFALGAYTAYETGKIVGSLAEIIIWVIAKASGSTLIPRPAIVGEYGGIKDIPKIWWDGLEDVISNGLWNDTTKPTIEDIVHGIKDKDYALLGYGIFRLLTLPPSIVSDIVRIGLTKFVEMIGAIFYTALG